MYNCSDVEASCVKRRTIAHFILAFACFFLPAITVYAQTPNLEQRASALEQQLCSSKQLFTQTLQASRSTTVAPSDACPISGYKVVACSPAAQNGIYKTPASRGEEVKRLQAFLKTLPGIYPSGLVTGYFGPQTEAAVRRFQRQQGLTENGIVGPLTRARLNALSANCVSAPLEIPVAASSVVPVGIPGTVGGPGPTGATGSVGTPGATGVSGPAGATGASGSTGATGAAGAPGFVGDRGSSGSTGATGGAGATGLTGLTGSNGSVGAIGLTGPIGLTGLSGSAGATGTIGLTGIIGPIGNTGAIGITGVTGLTGLSGPIGITGAVGLTGPVGLTGITGSAGATGTIGLTGIIGPIGNTGAIGITGLTGLTGLTGPIGITGPIGLTGSQGATGSAGSTGATGSAGSTGATGSAGATGATGSAGAAGSAGSTGSVGATGATGPAGAAGAAGASGVIASAQYVQLGSQPATVGAGQPFTYSTTVLSTTGITSATAVFNPPFTAAGTVFTLANAGRYEVAYKMTYPTDGGVELYLGTTLAGMAPLPYTMIGKTPDGTVSGNVIIETTSPNELLSVNAAAGNAAAIGIPPNSSTTNQSATTLSIKQIQ